MTAAPRPPTSDPPRGGAAPRPAGGYEFADAEKDSFRALAASVSFVGVCTMLFGVMAFVFGAGLLYFGFVPHALGAGAFASVCSVASFWTVSAGRSLAALVRTRGRDVEDLMEAVVQFRRLFGLARVLIVVIAMLAVAGCSLLVWCTLVPDRGGKCLNLLG
jgi:hypothetical protein